MRVLSDASVQPTSFLWRNQTRYVADIGRQWSESIDGSTVRVYMVLAVDNSTYELRYDPAQDRWTIHRAWLADVIA